MRDNLLRTVVLVVLALGLMACAEVKPWQKQNLSRRVMSLNDDPLETKFRDHVYDSREAGRGGRGVGGGGCGCS